MQPRSILVRSPSWVGDAVMATPTLRALREAHRDATITLEAPSRLAPLYAGLDSFDHFLPTPRGMRASLERVRAMRKSDFDWAEQHQAYCNGDVKLVLQPEWNSPHMLKSIVEYVKRNPDWTISLQTHKYLNIQ